MAAVPNVTKSVVPSDAAVPNVVVPSDAVPSDPVPSDVAPKKLGINGKISNGFGGHLVFHWWKTRTEFFLLSCSILYKRKMFYGSFHLK
jgi:hypothetical protein